MLVCIGTLSHSDFSPNWPGSVNLLLCLASSVDDFEPYGRPGEFHGHFYVCFAKSHSRPWGSHSPRACCATTGNCREDCLVCSVIYSCSRIFPRTNRPWLPFSRVPSCSQLSIGVKMARYIIITGIHQWRIKSAFRWRCLLSVMRSLCLPNGRPGSRHVVCYFVEVHHAATDEWSRCDSREICQICSETCGTSRMHPPSSRHSFSFVPWVLCYSLLPTGAQMMMFHKLTKNLWSVLVWRLCRLECVWHATYEWYGWLMISSVMRSLCPV